MSQVATAPHELEGRFKFAQWGMKPYHAIPSVMLGEPFEGRVEVELEHDAGV